MVYPARSVSADPLVFAVGALHVTSMFLSDTVGADPDVDPVDAELDDEVVVPLDIESGSTLVVVLVALGVAFEALVPLVSLHPASRPEADSKQHAIHQPLAPIARPS
jgi:hypothetical protein